MVRSLLPLPSIQCDRPPSLPHQGPLLARSGNFSSKPPPAAPPQPAAAAAAATTTTTRNNKGKHVTTPRSGWYWISSSHLWRFSLHIFGPGASPEVRPPTPRAVPWAELGQWHRGSLDFGVQSWMFFGHFPTFPQGHFDHLYSFIVQSRIERRNLRQWNVGIHEPPGFRWGSS